MDKRDTLRQLEEMAEESDKLAAYFKASAALGETLPVPSAVALKLVEVLATAAKALRAIALEGG